MINKMLDLKEAALFLNMSPEALRQKAAEGLIPGAKPGKKWCFHPIDLEKYMRSLYPKSAKASWGDTRRRNLCHSTKEAICGGLTSATKVNEYKKQLGLLTKKQPKGCMTR